jgi:hypothetical protein
MRLHFLIVLLIVANVFAGNGVSRKILDLDGYWKFEIGDNPEWAEPSYDDNDWEDLAVPSSWEDEGFPGYDGFAWYRTAFTINSAYSEKTLYLHLGAIDDVDEIYLNGNFIAYSGSLPPNYQTFAHNLRTYTLSNDFINFSGENILAIRIYDGGGLGGITWGNNYISMYREPYVPEINLSGTWKFRQGDDERWKEKDIDDRNWQDVIVPAFFCAYGLKDYDGFAWYRKGFRVPAALRKERLILLLGEIDDLDETYINGHLVGQVGDMVDNPDQISVHHQDRWTLRAYYIPRDILKVGGKNTVAVRVYDKKGYGGIYDGPIGVITRDNYLKLKRRKEPKPSFFESLLKDL